MGKIKETKKSHNFANTMSSEEDSYWRGRTNGVLKGAIALGGLSMLCGMVNACSDMENKDFSYVIDKTLTFGPTAVQAIAGAMAGQSFWGEAARNSSDQENIPRELKFAAIGGGAYGAIGAGLGAVESAIGYGFGYAAGTVTKLVMGY